MGGGHKKDEYRLRLKEGGPRLSTPVLQCGDQGTYRRSQNKDETVDEALDDDCDRQGHTASDALSVIIADHMCVIAPCYLHCCTVSLGEIRMTGTGRD